MLAERQAEDILLLDLRELAAFTDYFIIASAVNVRQMRALLEAVEKALKEESVGAPRSEGVIDSGWVLLDLGDVIIHLFSPEERVYYDIERLWSGGTPVVRIQ